MKANGTHVTMTENAIENYGEEWRGVDLEITAGSNKYMPSADFYAKGMPSGFHPGYDEGVSPQGLYDLRVVETGKDLAMSLYDWELE